MSRPLNVVGLSAPIITAGQAPKRQGNTMVQSFQASPVEIRIPDSIAKANHMKEIGVKHGMDPGMANKKWRANFPTPFIHTNWPVISILIILLVANIGFNFIIDPTQASPTNTACFTLFQHIVTLAISGCLGIAWSAFIRSTKTPELQYFSKYKNNENCKKASSKEFKCKIYKNGQEVGSTSGDNIFTIQA